VTLYLLVVRAQQRGEDEQARAQLDVVLTSLRTALLMVNGDGETILANQAYVGFFGSATARFQAEDVHGRPLAREDSPQWRAAHGESFVMEFAIAARQGRRQWFEAVGNPLAVVPGDEKLQRGGLIVIREITESRGRADSRR
jgi:PAS domain-containing protein